MGKFGNFELNEAQRKVLAEKNQRRNELRNLYWKNITDPHRHATGEGGHLFDPAVMRFQSMRVSHTEFFKPNFKTFKWGALLVVLPVIGFAQLFKWDRETREKKYRNGEVSYRERPWKFV